MNFKKTFLAGVAIVALTWAAQAIYLQGSQTPGQLASGPGTPFVAADGSVTIAPASPKITRTHPADPTGTTSATAVMMGLAVANTPARTGGLLIMVSGTIKNGTANDGANVAIRYGTGTAPANGDAATGTVCGTLNHTVGSTAATTFPYAMNCYVSGLTVGTAYWIDLGLLAVTGGTASVLDLEVIVLEQ